jgi:DNA modification methylase
VHCSDLPFTKGKDGVIGIKDFSGMLIRAHEEFGFVLHSRVTIRKSPVVEVTRTKALGLLYKQLIKDSSRSRQGMPDYLLVFRTPGENDDAVTHKKDEFTVDQWQEWAEPVWMDIRQTNTLNARAARDQADERHVCPLQLDLIERAITLWSNPGDTVLSPFMGIGSEGFIALQLKRKFLGVELKESYFKASLKHLQSGHLKASSFFNDASFD